MESNNLLATIRLKLTLVLAVFAYLFLGSNFFLQAEEDDLEFIQKGLLSLSLEELMNIEVISVSKKAQKLSESAAAIFVITQDDIRRSGATTIADALRMVPGLQVAKINSHAWAISSRGFNNFYASKLLVLIDGRSIYNPEFSGVYWDTADTMLDNIEQIEIIRGPGGTLWGANAVNGVINIITKKTEDTQGNLLVARGGTEDNTLSVRHGGKLGKDESTHYRIYAKSFRRDNSANTTQKDDWQANRVGFRLDSELNQKNSVTLEGDVYDGEEHDISFLDLQPIESEIRGGHLLGKWRHTFSSNSDVEVQIYYDYAKRTVPIQSTNNIFDIDMQHRYRLNKSHEFLWGLGYRNIKSNIPETSGMKFTPPERRDNLFSAFLQDEITLSENELVLTIGSKFEHNDYTGFEIQPNARLLWTPTEERSIWAAISKAVKTPTRTHHDAIAEIAVAQDNNPFYPIPSVILFKSNQQLDSESVHSYEIGGREQLTSNLSWDIALFFNKYQKLAGGESFISMDEMPNRVILLNPVSNIANGKSYGGELAINWLISDEVNLRAAYSYLDTKLTLHDEIISAGDEDVFQNANPQHQFSLRSSIDLNSNLQTSIWVRYVDNLPSDVLGHVNSYTTLDASLAWQASKNLTLSLVGQNLLDKQHHEFGLDPFNPLLGEVERSIYGQIRWQF